MKNPVELSVEELQVKLTESQQKIEALERAKTGLQGDLVKRKGVERLAKALGVDLSADDAEDKIAALLATKAPAVAAPAPAGGTPAPAPQPSQPAATGTPSSAVEEALRAQMTSLQNQVSDLNEQLQTAEKEKQKERRARLEEYKRSLVMQELDKAGCKRSAHVYALQGGNFRLLDDEKTVVYGPEEGPVNVSDAVANLEKDEEYSIYFPGVTASGSGLPTSRSSMPVTDNPFTKSGGNATKAAEIIQRDKGYAQRLVQQARARGDVDPRLAKAAGL